MKRTSANHKTDEIMTVSALARYLHCDRHTIYKLLKKKQIPAFKVGSDWRFRRSDIDEWIARQYDTTSPPVTRAAAGASAASRKKEKRPTGKQSVSRTRGGSITPARGTNDN